jgi:hypothetical protein
MCFLRVVTYTHTHLVGPGPLLFADLGATAR